jgi:hypothetical protein
MTSPGPGLDAEPSLEDEVDVVDVGAERDEHRARIHVHALARAREPFHVAVAEDTEDEQDFSHDASPTPWMSCECSGKGARCHAPGVRRVLWARG